MLAGYFQRALCALEWHDPLAQRAGGIRGCQVDGAEDIGSQACTCGQTIYLLLQRKLHLHRPKTAKCASNTVVGIGQSGTDIECLILIGAGSMLQRCVQHFWAMGGISTGVRQNFNPMKSELALRIAASAHAYLHGVALDAHIH